MQRNLHTKCETCGILLSIEYPHMLCPTCWKAKYHAPPGECRIDYFEEATKHGEIKSAPKASVISPSLLRASCPG